MQAQRIEFADQRMARLSPAALDPDAPMSAWAGEQPSPPDLRRHRHVAIMLTPFAFPGEIAPRIDSEKRWMRHWSSDARRPVADLVARLQRSPRGLLIQDRPDSGDVEILGRVPGEADAVPLALVAMGLTAEECRVALNELAGPR